MSRTNDDKALANKLARRYQRGEKDALGYLYSLLIPYMVRKARSSGAGEDAQDIAHDAFLRLTVRLSDTSRPVLIDNVLAYSTTAVHRLTLNLLRQKRRQAVANIRPGHVLDSLCVGDESQSPEAIVNTHLSEQSRRAILADALSRLAPHYRQVIEMHSLYGMRYAQIEQTLGVPVGTVINRFRHARSRLKDMLTSKLGEEN